MKQVFFGELGVISDNSNEKWETLVGIIKELCDYDEILKERRKKDKKGKNKK